MVHNGVEYGMMQAYAEGFESSTRREYELDMRKIAHLWNQGSVVRSWLLELAASAFEQEGNDLADIGRYVQDSGEGRWTSPRTHRQARAGAGDHRVALARFASRGRTSSRGEGAGGAAQPVRRPRRRARRTQGPAQT